MNILNIFLNNSIMFDKNLAQCYSKAERNPVEMIIMITSDYRIPD